MNEFRLTENSIQYISNLPPAKKFLVVKTNLQILTLNSINNKMCLSLSDGLHYYDGFLFPQEKMTEARQYDFVTLERIVVEEDINKLLTITVPKFQLIKNDTGLKGSPKKIILEEHEKFKNDLKNNFQNKINNNLYSPILNKNNNLHFQSISKVSENHQTILNVHSVKVNSTLSLQKSNIQVKEEENIYEKEVIQLNNNKEINNIQEKLTKEKIINFNDNTNNLNKKNPDLNLNFNNPNLNNIEKENNLIIDLEQEQNYENDFEDSSSYYNHFVKIEDEDEEDEDEEELELNFQQQEVIPKANEQHNFFFSNYEEFQDNFSIKVRIIKYDITERNFWKIWVIDRSGEIGILIIPSEKIKDYTNILKLHQTFLFTKVILTKQEGVNSINSVNSVNSINTINLTNSSEIKESNLKISLCNKEDTLSDYVKISQLPNQKNNFFKMLVYVLEVERQKFNAENGFVITRKLLVTDESKLNLEIILINESAKIIYEKGDIIYIHMPTRKSSDSGIILEQGPMTRVEVNPPSEFVQNYKNKIIKLSCKFSFLSEGASNDKYEKITSKGIHEQINNYNVVDSNKIFEFKCTIISLYLNCRTVSRGCPNPYCKHRFRERNYTASCLKCHEPILKKDYTHYWGIELVCKDLEETANVFLPHDESVRLLKILDFNHTAEQYRILSKDNQQNKKFKEVKAELKHKLEFLEVIFRGKIVSYSGKNLKSHFRFEVTDFLPSFLSDAKNLYWHDKINSLNDILFIN